MRVFMKLCLWLPCLLLGMAVTSYAQKVKYKDLFVLLDGKNYKDAAPFLRKFLADQKNDLHPNANFQMGLLYEQLAKQVNILKATDQHSVYVDSALLHFKKSLSLITEKEVKKNDEYYQAYSRRDMRTGKFGVKLSDVHYDIEKKSKDLKNRGDLVSQLKIHFTKSVNGYNHAWQRYQKLKQEYSSIETLWLRGDSKIVAVLDSIVTGYDTMERNFDQYKSILPKIGNTSYDQKLSILSIESFEKDGVQESDFFENSVAIWNYKGWASQTKEVIEKELKPLTDDLIILEERMRTLAERLKQDKDQEASQEISILEQEGDGLAVKLQKYSSVPFPTLILKLKALDLRWYSQMNRYHQNVDSTDVAFQVMSCQQLMTIALEMNTLVQKLKAREQSKDALDFKRFVNKVFGDQPGMMRFFQTQTGVANTRKQNAQRLLDKWLQRSRWALLANDSIPLFHRESFKRGEGNNYFQLHNDTLNTKMIYSSGVFLTSTNVLKGYYAVVPPSLVVSKKVDFKMDKSVFSEDILGGVQTLSYYDSLDGYYMLHYFPIPENEKLKGQLTKISDGGKYLWSKTISLSKVPVILTKEPVNGDKLLIHYIDPNKKPGDLSAPVQFVVSKKGTLIGEK